MGDTYVKDADILMDNNDTQPMYGVWIPGEGWLKSGQNSQFPQFADRNRAIAEQVARCVGRGAKVRYIDKSIVELEQDYIENEGRSLWRRLTNYLERSNSK